MISSSTKFGTIAKSGSTPYFTRIKYNGEVLDCNIFSCKIVKGSTGNESFGVGTVFVPYVEIEADNLSVNLENREISIEVGLKVDSVIEWITLGYFTVTKAKSSSVRTKITAVGRITGVLGGILVSVTPHAYGTTISDLVYDIQNAVRNEGYPDFTIILKNIRLTGITTNGELDAIPPNGLSCKQMLDLVAGITGAYITEDNAGNVVMFKYDTTYQEYDGTSMLVRPVVDDYDFTLANLKAIKTEAYINEDGVDVPEVSFVSGTPIDWTISNKYLTEDIFNEIVCDNVLNLIYRPATISLAIGDPRLEATDSIQVTDTDGKIYKIPCMSIEHNIAGSVSSTIIAPSVQEESTSYLTEAGPVTKQIQQVNTQLLTVEEAVAKRLKVTDLTAQRISSIVIDAINLTSETIDADRINASELAAKVGTFGFIKANEVETGYAKIDAANINTSVIQEAWIDKLLVQTGLLAQTGTVFTLDAIQVNANNITAGTLDVQRLIVTVDGQKYLVQFDTEGSPTYQKLDGNIIQDNTVTADKILAHSITARELTVNNIVGTGGWINFAEGTFAYNNNQLGTGISWDGQRLTIKADSIILTGSDLATAINDVNNAVSDIQDRIDSGEFNLSVRNFIHNSRDMIYTNYGFDTAVIPEILVNELGIALSDENGITLIS